MASTTAWFSDWFNSTYYHQLYFKRDEKEASIFIQKLLDYLKPAPQSKMLDVACGRGRHSKMLAAAGFDVTGIDISPESIQYAKQSEQPHLQFFEHDMRLPFYIHYFDVAFNFFTSFGYFNTDREHSNAIRSIAQSLKKGGIFVIDYLNSTYTEAHLVPEEIKEIDGIKFEIQRWSDSRFFFKKITIHDPSLPHAFTHTEKVAKFSREDFQAFFTQHHLEIRESFGNYDLSAFDLTSSPRLILVAQKTQ